MKRPFVVSFEGIEGSGKTTQFSLFIKFLKKSRLKILALREPGSTLLGEKLREILLFSRVPISTFGEILLFSASRAQLLKEKVIPVVKNLDLVIFDRFVDSTLAYQGLASGAFPLKGKDRDFTFQELEVMVRRLALGFWPDLTFIFDLPLKEAFGRKKDRDRFFKKNLSFHYRVKRAYRFLARRDPQRIVLIPSQGEGEKVFSRVLKEFLKKCPNYIKTSIPGYGSI